MKQGPIFSKTRATVLLMLTGIALLAMAACSSDSTPDPTPTPEGTGALRGTINIGPLCPVEPCNDAANPFEDLVVVMTRTDESQSGEVPVDEKGEFIAIDVPVGEYFVDVRPCEWLGCSTELPWQVRILPNFTTPISINIDTGIR